MSTSGYPVIRLDSAPQKKDDLLGDFQLDSSQPDENSDEELEVEVDKDGLRAVNAATARFQDRLNRRLRERRIELQANGCLVCFKAPVKPGSYLCTRTCLEWAHDRAPRLLPVPKSHNIWNDIRNRFKMSWRHPEKKCPQFQFLYKIICSKKINDNYYSYLDQVESKRKFSATGQPAGNERMRWHGTVRDCALGDAGNINLCQSEACSLCGIIRTSFDLAFFGRKTGWGRFGRGIYTSSTSSKSTDYSENTSNVQSKWKALLLNKVVVGRGQVLLRNASSLNGAPDGFDSVLGEPGEALNYDEVAVYDNRANIPSYLVIY